MKILTIEDNLADVEILRELLIDTHVSSCELVSARTLAEGMSLFAGGDIDFVILDLGLPDSQGIDTLRSVRTRFPFLPIVVLTGFDDDETGILAVREGAQDYLVKGQITSPSLMRSIRYAHERKRTEQELVRKNNDLDMMNEELRQNLDELTKKEQELRESEGQLKKGNEKLALLAESAQVLLTSGTPEHIVQTISEKIMQYLDCQVFFNYIIEEGKKNMQLNAYAGIPEATAREIRRLDFGIAVCGCVARDEVPIIAEDISHTPDVRTDLVHSFGITAYACHPLIYQGRTIGTLSFGTSTRPRFSEEDIEFIRAITDLVATAMARKKVERELIRKNEDLSAAYEKIASTGEELRQNVEELSLRERELIKSEADLKEALSEKEVLLSEIHHRVKNNLTAFISLLSLEGSYEDSEGGRALREDLQNRARSMALIHETLYRTGKFSEVNMEAYLTPLVGQIAASYTKDSKVLTIVDARSMVLDLSRATTAGLIVNELVTNSFKYAFPPEFDCMAVRGGPPTIRVSFSHNDGIDVLSVADNGHGLPLGFDPFATQSLGLKLVNFLARHQLRADIDIREDRGTEFIFRLKNDEGNA